MDIQDFMYYESLNVNSNQQIGESKKEIFCLALLSLALLIFLIIIRTLQPYLDNLFNK